MAATQVVRRIINTAKAPTAIGPYNQAVLVDNTLYVSGQIGLVPGTGELVSGGVEAQANQTLTNLGAILQEAGITFNNVVKTTVMLSDIADYPAVNQVYASYFKDKQPARAAYQVAALPKGARVEIEVVAITSKLVDV